MRRSLISSKAAGAHGVVHALFELSGSFIRNGIIGFQLAVLMGLFLSFHFDIPCSVL
jgi:hypothetical protein